MPWMKHEISVGGQLAGSSLWLGVEWAGCPHGSHGLEHKPRGGWSLWEALALLPQAHTYCPSRTLGQQTTMTHVCLANFAISRMYSTVPSKMMPSLYRWVPERDAWQPQEAAGGQKGVLASSLQEAEAQRGLRVQGCH